MIQIKNGNLKYSCRDGSRTAATSSMECFVIIVNGWKPLAIIAKHSILDAATTLDPPLLLCVLNVFSGNLNHMYSKIFSGVPSLEE